MADRTIKRRRIGTKMRKAFIIAFTLVLLTGCEQPNIRYSGLTTEGSRVHVKPINSLKSYNGCEQVTALALDTDLGYDHAVNLLKNLGATVGANAVAIDTFKLSTVSQHPWEKKVLETLSFKSKQQTTKITGIFFQCYDIDKF